MSPIIEIIALDLLGVEHVVGQVVVDLGVGEVAALLAEHDQLLQAALARLDVGGRELARRLPRRACRSWPFLLAASSARLPASLAAISLVVGLCGRRRAALVAAGRRRPAAAWRPACLSHLRAATGLPDGLRRRALAGTLARGLGVPWRRAARRASPASSASAFGGVFGCALARLGCGFGVGASSPSGFVVAVRLPGAVPCVAWLAAPAFAPSLGRAVASGLRGGLACDPGDAGLAGGLPRLLRSSAPRACAIRARATSRSACDDLTAGAAIARNSSTTLRHAGAEMALRRATS